MTSKGVTDLGRKTFGEFLRHIRENDLGKKQEELAVWLTEQTGIVISKSAIGRIENGYWSDSFAFNVLIALEDSGILKLPDGKKMDFNKLMEVLRGNLDPYTGKAIAPKAKVR